MRTITKTQAEMIEEIIRYDGTGAIPVSQWTTGRGRFTRRRPTPPYCRVISRKESKGYPKRIQEAFKNNRVQAVVAIVDMRKAKSTLELKAK